MKVVQRQICVGFCRGYLNMAKMLCWEKKLTQTRRLKEKNLSNCNIFFFWSNNFWNTINTLYEIKYSRMDQMKFARQLLKNWKRYGRPQQTISFQIFQRLSSTNFTWSILEYFVPYSIQSVVHCLVFSKASLDELLFE